MARRQIGQEQLWRERATRPGGGSLDEAAALVAWAELDRLLAGISASAKGEPGWPPQALFRVLLLATWYDLSDVQLAACGTALPPICWRAGPIFEIHQHFRHQASSLQAFSGRAFRTSQLSQSFLGRFRSECLSGRFLSSLSQL